jgi:LPXTG-site transpeptidase (sortase) family protein
MPKKKTARSSKKEVKTSKKTNTFHSLLLKRITGLIFLLISLTLILFPIQFTNNQPVAKNPIVINSKLLENVKKENVPVRILIPSVKIDLSVTTSNIVNGYWELSETTASYGLGSGYPSQKGNTVIFAHAREGLFYNLKDVKKEDTIYVFSKDKWFKYKVNKITTVYPNQVEVIKPTKNEVLTLYTCTGFADEKRLVITALPVK